VTAKLRVLDTRRSECRRSVVATLEKALEQAKDGEVVAVALAVVRPDMTTETAWSEVDALSALIGGVARLSVKLIATVE
jgi:hypothetical protein